jgi:hypothetical protein
MLRVRSALWIYCLLVVLTGCSSEKRELKSLASPDHATTAIVMQELGGGATVSSVYSIYLSEDKGKLSEPILTATYCGGLAVSWEGDRTLQVEYDSDCNIRQFINHWWSRSAIQNAQSATVEIVLLRRQDKGARLSSADTIAK